MQMRDIEAAHVAQLDPFQMRPKPLTWVQLRGERRQAPEMETLGRPVGQELLNEVAAMHWGTIPDEAYTARHLTPQVLQEGDHIGRVHGMALTAEVELAHRRDGGNRREVIAAPPVPQDGRPTHGRRCSHDTGQRLEARFVYKEDGLPLGFRPFWLAGQVRSCHWTIAASSRWRARRIGFCGLHCICCRMRLT
jgi:hypothetical protein